MESLDSLSIPTPEDLETAEVLDPARPGELVTATLQRLGDQLRIHIARPDGSTWSAGSPDEATVRADWIQLKAGSST